MNLPAEQEAEIPTDASNIIQQMLDLFLQY